MNDKTIRKELSLGDQNNLKAKIKTMRVVIYARVSSEEQAKKEFSIPEIQVPECMKCIREMGWNHVGTYIDKGIDGNAFLKRPELQKMLIEDINTFDILITWSFDRLTRDDEHTRGQIFSILDKNKKQITSVLQRTKIVSFDKYDPKDLNVSSLRQLNNIQVSFDSKIRRQRFMESRTKTVERGKHISEPPYGYKMKREPHPRDPRRTIGYRLPNKNEVPILHKIFTKRANQGKSYRKIALELNQKGIKARRGGQWTGSRIYQVLINPFPCGYIVWNKTQERKYGDENILTRMPEDKWEFIQVNKGEEKYYKPVISRSLFRKAQEIRKRNYRIKGRAAGSSNILVGLVKCPICKSPMITTSHYRIKKEPYTKTYLVCSHFHNKGSCSGKKYPSWPIKKKILKKTKAFLNQPKEFKEYLETRMSNNGIKEKEKELKSYKNELEKVQKRIKVLNLKYIDDKIKENYYYDLLTELEENKEKIEGFIATLIKEIQKFNQKDQNGRSLEILSKKIKNKFDTLKPDQIKLIIRILVKEIILGEKREGKGVKGNPYRPTFKTTWNNPAIMEQGCASQIWLQYDEYQKYLIYLLIHLINRICHLKKPLLKH